MGGNIQNGHRDSITAPGVSPISISMLGIFISELVVFQGHTKSNLIYIFNFYLTKRTQIYWCVEEEKIKKKKYCVYCDAYFLHNFVSLTIMSLFIFPSGSYQYGVS